MCELLGLSLDPPAELDVFFKAFRPRAEANQSGWGVGWYEESAARLVKEPLRADESPKAAELLADPPTSDIFLIHVRRATVGPVSPHNTHPFLASMDGRDWLFAHNGTIKGLSELAVGDWVPAGDTDSEVAFHYLLTRIDALPADADEEKLIGEVFDAACELSRNGKANFLLSDGSRLFAYYDGHTTLHYMVRSRRADENMRVADDSDYVVDVRVPEGAREKGVIVASMPLTKQEWTPLLPGQMLVCRRGEITHLLGPGND